MKKQYHVEGVFTPKNWNTGAAPRVARKFYFDTDEEQELFMERLRERDGWSVQRYGITHRSNLDEAMVQCMEIESRYQ